MDTPSLTHFFVQAGQILTMENCYRFLLHNQDAILYIEEGTVDLFAIFPTEEIVSPQFLYNKEQEITPFLAEFLEGPLLYLNSFSQKELLFGFPTPKEGDSMRIVAIANSHLQLRRLSFDQVQKHLMQDPHFSLEFQLQLDGWVKPFQRHIFHKPFEVDIIGLTPGSQATIAEGLGVGIDRLYRDIHKEILWVRVIEGVIGYREQYYIEKMVFELGPDDPPYPLGGKNALLIFKNAVVRGISTEELLQQNELRKALFHFHEILYRYIQFDRLTSIHAENADIQYKMLLENKLLDTSLKEVSKIFSAEAQKALTPTSDDLFKTCEIIGSVLDIKFQMPPWRKVKTSVDERVYNICTFSHINYRHITLEKNWWHHSAGPYLCFNKQGHPLAAIPNQKGEYHLVEPTTLEEIPLTDARVAELATGGYTFYRSFPTVEKLSQWELLRFFLFGQKRNISLVLLLSLAGIVLGLFIPVAIQSVFDDVIPSLDENLLWQLIIAMVIIQVSVALFQLVREYAILRFFTISDNQLQVAVWDRVLKLPVSFFKKYQDADIFLRVNTMEGASKQFFDYPLRMILDFIFSFFYFIVMFYYSPILTFGFIVLFIIVFFLAYRFIRQAAFLQRKILEIKTAAYSKVLEIVNSISKIRASGLETNVFAYWLHLFNQSKIYEQKAQINQNILKTINESFGLLGLFLLFAVMIYQSQHHTAQFLTVGAFFAFLAAFGPFSTATTNFLNILVWFQNNTPLWQRFMEMMHQEIPASLHRKERVNVLEGHLNVEMVNYRYSEDDPYALQDINLEAKPGEFIALVGPTGSGKSTLLRLILGLAVPESGEISFDDHDLRNIDITDLMRHLGVVLQDSKILSGSLKEIITGNRLYSYEEIMEAIRIAGFEKDLERLPMGLSTVILNGGMSFSGGQVQRILIAQAIIRKPRVLIFDEATSALDNQTQEQVSKSLEKMKMTRIVVAHRLSTVRNADRIYVFQGGRIIEVGNYNELVAKGGLFTTLVNLQKM